MFKKEIIKMDKKINCINSIVCENPDSPFNYFGWPSVTRLPDGTLAAAASGFRLSHVCPFGKAVICYSSDGGSTWTRPAPVIDTPLDDRDAGITVTADGRVIFTSFNNDRSMQYDWNKRNFGTPKFNLISAYLNMLNFDEAEKKYLGSTYRISHDGGYTFSEIKRCNVSAPHGVCALPGGKVLYIGRVFSGYTENMEKDRIECHVLNENDEFEFLSAIEPVYVEGRKMMSSEPHALALSDTHIIVHIRVQNYYTDKVQLFTIYQSESLDGGKSWTQPKPLGVDGSPPHLLCHSSGVLISAYGRRTPPFGQRVMFSTDNGKTWDMDYILRDDGPSSDLGYPCSVELDDGRILTVYYQQKPGESNCVIMQSIWELPRHFVK